MIRVLFELRLDLRIYSKFHFLCKIKSKVAQNRISLKMVMESKYFSKLLLVILVTVTISVHNSFFVGADGTEEGEFDDCRMSDDEAKLLPWSAGLTATLDTGVVAYYPVVIIGPYTLLAGERAFRAPYPKEKLQILANENYSISFGNPQIQQQLEVSYIKPFPNISEFRSCWMKTDRDIILIHLSTPITFSKHVRRLCLPNFDSQPQIQTGENHLVTGWKCKYNYALTHNTTAFDFKVHDEELCRQIWMVQPENVYQQEMAYTTRICGTPSLWQGFGNATKDTKFQDDSGNCFEKSYFNIRAMDKEGDPRPKRVLVGLLNGIAQGILKEPTAFISLLTEEMVAWINNSIDCGPENYTCHSGQCVPVDKICDKTPDCDDGSDEDRIYCRARNFCTVAQFECGVQGDCVPLISSDTGKEAKNCDKVPDCGKGEDEVGCEDNDNGEPDSTKSPSVFEQSWPYIVFSGIGTFFFVLAIGGALVRRITANKMQMNLSYAEILKFRQGDPVETNFDFEEDPPTPDADHIQLNSMQMPYIYDLERKMIQFGDNIGSGAYGDVYRGHYNGKIVAIKELKKGVVDKEMFKTFLQELKIMAYVNFIKGGHENVIKLIGAVTDNIRNLELFIVEEFCESGSIVDYLKVHRVEFEAADEIYPEIVSTRGSMTAGTRYVSAATLQPSIGKFHLHKWVKQIVAGMCFLAKNKIVHGDLAARNILLESNLNAKISDFGLARQIYYYKCAKIDKKTRVPWPWMAPEVLESMKISTKSDVWSFGIVLWELFSLCAVPYGGLEWSQNFVDQLKCGLRLTKPPYASDAMFSIMQDCWKYTPSERPDFETLRERIDAVSI